MKQFLRQPLLHFIAIGAFIFAVDSWLNPSDGGGDQVIDVSASRITALARNWEARRMRPPDWDEVRDLVDGYIREEILYREARKLGLDQDDAVVRRRLAQKIEFLYRDLQPISEPDEKSLQEYYAAHAERYREPVRLSFRQVHFSPDRRGKAVLSSARSALVSLRNGQAEAGGSLGDPSLLHYGYSGLSRQDIRGRFGEEFAQKLMALPAGGQDHLRFLGDRPGAEPLGVMSGPDDRRYVAR